MAIFVYFSHVAAYIYNLKPVIQELLKSGEFNQKKLLITFIKL